MAGRSQGLKKPIKENYQGLQYHLSIQEKKFYLFVSLSGKLFIEYEDLLAFQKKITVFHEKQKPIVCDLAGVTYVNSRGLKEIIAIHKKGMAQGLRLFIAGASSSVQEVFTVMSLPKEICFVRSLSEAIRMMQ
jgi:anti-anti-sigma factor